MSPSERTVGAALRGRPRFINDRRNGVPPVSWIRVPTEGGHGGPPLQFVLRRAEQAGCAEFVLKVGIALGYSQYHLR